MAPDAMPTGGNAVWVTAEPDGTTRLGLEGGLAAEDAFITGVRFAQAGSRLAAGDVLCTLELKTKVCEGNSCTYQASELTLRAPAPLVIAQTNPMVKADPLLLQIDPRGTGWIAIARIDEPTVQEIEKC
jgi:glycine cleavage system H lipoate-binding protein